ncbi:LOW QUALITY PROTEIN: peroxidase domain-containing protein, partial [Cephalotus follicularis]
QGCDASVFLDDSNGDRRHCIERDAIPHMTLKGFDKINMIKEELEQVCPVISCADTTALATRDGIVLAGGPFYPVFTGRRDSLRSYFEEDSAKEKPSVFWVLTCSTTFSLISWGHNIGKIGCEFIRARLYNFSGTGQLDPSIASDFLEQIGRSCPLNKSSNSDGSPALMRSRVMSESTLGMGDNEELSSSISSRACFDTHIYQSLLRGRGLLFSDQQLMVDDQTAMLVRIYSIGNGSTFQMDFARVMVKLSNLGALTGSEGRVRINCSRLASSS